MIYLEDNKRTYEALDNSLKEIEESITMVRDSGKKFCFDSVPENSDLGELGELLTCVSDLKLSVKHFNQVIEDLMIEIQEAEFEVWENEQTKIEGEYYGEGNQRIKE